MTAFNKISVSKSIESNLLNVLRNELSNTLCTSPMYIPLLQRIESIEYSMHRARIVPTHTPVVHAHNNVSKEAHMTTPTFSNDLVVRKQQYMEYLVHTGDHTPEEVADMDMRTLRTHIDTYMPRIITVHTARANGGTSTHYIVRKAA